jgi:hypothetical protein
MDAQELLESFNSSTPSIDGILETLFHKRYTGNLPLVLHFRGGRVQVIEVLSSTQIRLNGRGPLDKSHGPSSPSGV